MGHFRIGIPATSNSIAFGATFGNLSHEPEWTRGIMNILTVNLLFSTFVFAILARIYVAPKLRTLDYKALLIPILLLHSTRHLGLMFLQPGAVFTGMAPQFAYPAAFGDFLAAILALLALLALIRGFKFSLFLVWIFCIEGSLDLLLAIALATKYDAVHFMGAAYWIPAFWVPALLVTHFLTFVILLRKQSQSHRVP